MPKYRPYSWTMTSAATLDAPKIECRLSSIDMSSVMPCSYGWPGSISYRVSSSTSGIALGGLRTPCWWNSKMNGAVGRCSRVLSSMLRVPTALTSKSVYGSFAAQSWLAERRCG